MYILQPYKGKSSRHTCPACGRKLSFTLYIDSNTNKALHSSVGKCNRAVKCAYHYSPKQYFNDNPNHNTDWKPNIEKPLQPLRKIDFIPVEYLSKSQSANSHFVDFLKTKFSSQQIADVLDKYKLGATRNKEVIFWQIDIQNRIRTAKIMQYNPLTGKRIKHQSGAIDWVHNKLKQQAVLRQSFNLKQCFFGEHLLSLYPSAHVAIVESEKTAIIATIMRPDIIWLAAGSLNGFSLEKCTVLKHRKIIVYPDLGAFNAWSVKALDMHSKLNLTIQISSILEDVATQVQKDLGWDIGDYLIVS